MARRTERQEARLLWRGRAMGGSSTINGQIAIRAVPDDLNRWAAAGCTGWDWAAMLPYFCKLESDKNFRDAPYHGDSGPIPVFARRPRTGARWTARCGTARRPRLRLVRGPQCADRHRRLPLRDQQHRGRRVSTNDGYLEPVRERQNLRIVGDALVEVIEMEGNRPHASGVRVRVGGQLLTSRAQREVILCAGAIHSPAILQRSGIGPAALLEKLGIQVRADLPVGENLLDHPIMGALLHLRDTAQVGTLMHRHTNCCLRYGSGLGGAGENDVIMIAGNLAGATLTRSGPTRPWADRRLRLSGLQPGPGPHHHGGSCRRSGGRGADAIGPARPRADARRRAPLAGDLPAARPSPKSHIALSMASAGARWRRRSTRGAR